MISTPAKMVTEYLVPVHADIPAIDVLFVDEPDFSLNPIGVKGLLGEIGLVGVAPAIANAVYHATGQRMRDLPITLDKLLERDDATGKSKPGGSLRGGAFPAIWAGSKTIRQRDRKGKVSSLPNWTGSDQLRLMELDGDQLTLSLPPAQVNGEIRISKLTWRRLSSP